MSYVSDKSSNINEESEKPKAIPSNANNSALTKRKSSIGAQVRSKKADEAIEGSNNIIEGRNNEENPRRVSSGVITTIE